MFSKDSVKMFLISAGDSSVDVSQGPELLPGLRVDVQIRLCLEWSILQPVCNEFFIP